MAPAGAPPAGEVPRELRWMRWVDLVALALALPVFLLAGFPMLGYAAAVAAWLAQRAVQETVERRAKASTDPRTVVGLTAASMIGRGWFVAFAIFGVGLADENAGLAAAVLFLLTFTVRFTAQAVLRSFEKPLPEPARARAKGRR